MDGAVKVLVYLFGALFLVVGIAVFWQDDSGQNLIDRISDSDGGQSAGGQQVGQVGDGGGIGQSDGQGDSLQESIDRVPPQILTTQAHTGYIVSYDSIGLLPSQADLEPTGTSVEYNWVDSNAPNIALIVYVQNNGDEISDSFIVKVVFDNEVRQYNVESMSAQSFLSIPFNYNNFNLGNHDLEVVVDEANVIIEANENNNRLEQGVVV